VTLAAEKDDVTVKSRELGDEERVRLGLPDTIKSYPIEPLERARIAQATATGDPSLALSPARPSDPATLLVPSEKFTDGDGRPFLSLDADATSGTATLNNVNVPSWAKPTPIFAHFPSDLSGKQTLGATRVFDVVQLRPGQSQPVLGGISIVLVQVA
jgi:hypothetical protein